MPASAPQNEVDKLREFELRMQTEGAAGFADGPEPWKTWPEPRYDGGNQRWESTPSEHTATPPGPARHEKLLSTVAVVAVVALVAGISGVYVSTDTTPRIAADDMQPAAVNAPQVASIEPQPAPAGTPAAPETDLSLPGSVIRRTPDSAAAWPSGGPVASRYINLPTGDVPAVQPDSAQADWLAADATANRFINLPTGDVPAVRSGSAGAGAQPGPAAVETAAADGMRNDSTRSGSATIAAVDGIRNNSDAPAPATTTAAADGTRSNIADTLPAPAAGKPATIAMVTPPATVSASQPVAPATAARSVAGDGPWVVNISSYTFESMARRKLQEFKKKGVTAEVFTATVNGRPMYRIRTTGYDSRAEAKTWVSLLEERLGVDSAWVSKR